MRSLKYLLLTGVIALMTGIAASCGSVDPALGAALIFEEQITDNIKLQIVLEDEDILEDSLDDFDWF